MACVRRSGTLACTLAENVGFVLLDVGFSDHTAAAKRAVVRGGVRARRTFGVVRDRFVHHLILASRK